MEKRKVLITGCSGFLASYLVEELERAAVFEICGMTDIKELQSASMTVYHVDIRDRERVLEVVEAVKPDLVFHLAAITNVGFSWQHQQLTYEVNFIGSSNLLEAVSQVSPRCRVLFMSSAELYGASQRALIDESAPTSAFNPYALSKLAMEMLGNLYIRTKNMDIIMLRSFNFIGPGQDRKFVASDFAAQIAEIEKGKRLPIILVGNLSAVRDFTDVRDIARYLAVISQRGEQGCIYNLCSGRAYSIRDILVILLSLSAIPIEVAVESDRFRPVDVQRLVGDSRLIRETFNLYPHYEIPQTMSDLLDYWRARV